MAASDAQAELVDRIYEAAFVPEFWPETLQRIAGQAGAVSGEFQLIADGAQPRWQATELTRDALRAFIEGGKWRQCERPVVLLGLDYPGFLCDRDYLDAEQLARDPVHEMLGAIGLGWQLGTLIPMPTGEVVGLTFERRLEDGKPGGPEVARLDALRPHLARAGLMAARLRLERARETVAALQALGLPAAVATGGGRIRVRATNRLFDETDGLFQSRAFDGLAIAHRAADALLQEAAEALVRDHSANVRSIPVPAADGRPAVVVHLIPLRRSAWDIFSGGELLVAITTVAVNATAPSPVILRGLFDLTPAETRLVTELSAGQSLHDAAARCGITVKSARTYLDRIFAKTGTHRQSELVALLKSAVAPSGGPPSVS